MVLSTCFIYTVLKKIRENPILNFKDSFLGGKVITKSKEVFCMKVRVVIALGGMEKTVMGEDPREGTRLVVSCLLIGWHLPGDHCSACFVCVHFVLCCI